MLSLSQEAVQRLVHVSEINLVRKRAARHNVDDKCLMSIFYLNPKVDRARSDISSARAA